MRRTLYFCSECNMLYKWKSSNGVCCGKKMRMLSISYEDYQEIKITFDRSVKLSSLTSQQLLLMRWYLRVV